MLAEWRRLARTLSHPPVRRRWFATLTVRSAVWVVFLAALADVWRVDNRLVPLLLLVAVVARLASGLLGSVMRAISVTATRFLVVAFVLLYGLAVYAGYIEALPSNVQVLALFALVAALAWHGVGSDAATPATDQWVMTFAERLALFAGPLVAAGLLLAVDPLALVIGSSALFVAADWLAARWRTSNTAPQPKHPDRGSFRDADVYLFAGAGSGALASSVLIGGYFIAGTDWRYGATAAAVVASVGFGSALFALPIPRLLLRVPAAALAAALSALMGIAATTAALAPDSPLIAIPALVIVGAAAASQHSLRIIALRRLSTGSARFANASTLALAAGQIVGALAILERPTPSGAVAVIVSVALYQFVLVALALVVSGRRSLQVGGLSSLPIKSVTHKLSWDTRPAAAASDFAGREPRARHLARWINRQVGVERLTVTLPISRLEYEIYRPDEVSRERLFEQGRADPEKQMPYWAKVWPSGVALADVVVERKMEVADRHVLELGAGLGVTACAVLEHGGHLVTADYSALPLAHCRLNTLVNTGRSPRATCFNWRHDGEVAAVTEQPDFANGFPLIIAGDVLYEGRDAEPLLNVIDRMLVADGSLWLAEPVRRTAQRFLDSAAALGWEIESRQIVAEWPDATDGPVNLHFLTRSLEPDRIVADLGGWRI